MLTLLLALLVCDAHAAVYGADDRADPKSLLDSSDQSRYSATQIIACEAAGGRFHAGAGNIAGDFTHGVSVAHLFYDTRLHRYHTTNECRFRVYDGVGKMLDEVEFKRRVIFGGERPDLGSDLSMFELARRPNFVDHPLQLHATGLYEGEELTLVAFHFDVRPAYTKRRTRGLVYSTLGTPHERVANIFHTDTDEVPMSSGGPFYDAHGDVVGLVQGGSRENDAERRPFDPLSNYNVGIRLDRRFLAEFENFVRGR